MKLRILGDSLRLRLSQSEVRQLGESGRVEQTIRFGPGDEMHYVLEHAADAPGLRARFEGRTITVCMPSTTAQAWSRGSEISLHGEQALDGGDVLALLVEKDFKCAVPRPGEENYDGFPHPTGAC